MPAIGEQVEVRTFPQNCFQGSLVKCEESPSSKLLAVNMSVMLEAKW